MKFKMSMAYPMNKKIITYKRREKMGGIIFFIIYLGAGSWAVDRTIYANKVIIGDMGTIWLKKLTLAFILGWILIPVAVIKSIISK